MMKILGFLTIIYYFILKMSSIVSSYITTVNIFFDNIKQIKNSLNKVLLFKIIFVRLFI